MKKIFLVLSFLMCITACNSKKDNILDNFIEKTKSTKSYSLSGKLELLDDEETYNYNIKVDYLKDDYYKVDMLNENNNRQQIILRNEDSVYVITPELNKSFKFESNWPNNSSQSYVLSSIINDINNDEKFEQENSKSNIIVKTKVNYPNNSELKYQKIYIDNEGKLEKVEVYNNADLVKIRMTFNDIDYKTKLSKKDFELNNYIQNQTEEISKEKQTMGKLENAIYPLYMPTNTYLTSSEVVDTETESRVILSFSGEKNFVLVEENTVANTEHEIIPVYGEPIMLNDTIGALSSNSMYWTSNDVDYYLASDDLTIDEMTFIATSLINSVATMYEK